MTILDEIREDFASLTAFGARKINSLPEECISFVIRIPDGYGVAIPVDEKMEVAESFNNCRFRTGLL